MSRGGGPAPLALTHRGDDGEVGQVAAPRAGVVAQDDVPLPQVLTQVADLQRHREGLSGSPGGRGSRSRGGPRGLSYLELDSLLHGTQVDRDVGGIGHQPPVRPEECAGEVQPLLDVGGDGRPLQDPAHLLCRGGGGTWLTLTRWSLPHRAPLVPSPIHGKPQPPRPPAPGKAGGQPPRTCDAHEAVGEDGELDGIELGADRARGPRADGDADVAEAGEAGGAARLHHDGAGGDRRWHRELEGHGVSRGPAGSPGSPTAPQGPCWLRGVPTGSSGSPTASWGPTGFLGSLPSHQSPASSLGSHCHPGVPTSPPGSCCHPGVSASSLGSLPWPRGPHQPPGSHCHPGVPASPLGSCCHPGVPTSPAGSYCHPGVPAVTPGSPPAPQGPTVTPGVPTCSCR